MCLTTGVLFSSLAPNKSRKKRMEPRKVTYVQKLENLEDSGQLHASNFAQLFAYKKVRSGLHSSALGFY